MVVGRLAARMALERRSTLSAESRRYYGTCARKTRHKTLPDAMRAKLATPGLAPYRCEFCGGWHLGKKTEKDEHRDGVHAAR